MSKLSLYINPGSVLGGGIGSTIGIVSANDENDALFRGILMGLGGGIYGNTVFDEFSKDFLNLEKIKKLKRMLRR